MIVEQFFIDAIRIQKCFDMRDCSGWPYLTRKDACTNQYCFGLRIIYGSIYAPGIDSDTIIDVVASLEVAIPRANSKVLSSSYQCFDSIGNLSGGFWHQTARRLQLCTVVEVRVDAYAVFFSYGYENAVLQTGVHKASNPLGR